MPEQVEYPTRRAHDSVNAVPEHLALRTQRAPAEHKAHLDPARLPNLLEHASNLHRELTCRGQNEHLRDAPRGINRLDGRNPEGKRLARPGLCLTDEILTIQKQWQRRGLNRCRLGDSHEGQRIESGWTYGEMGKRHESFIANRDFRRNDFQWQSILFSAQQQTKQQAGTDEPVSMARRPP